MRAVMGLYLGMVVFWLCGAFSRSMAAPALAACAVFMLGLATGRMLSFILDGLPHWLLVVYAALEVVLGLVAIALYRVHDSEQCPTAMSSGGSVPREAAGFPSPRRSSRT